MTLYLLAATVIVSFLTTYLSVPYFIRFLKRANIVGTDVNKISRPPVPEMGAPVVVVGFLAGIFLYIWISVFSLGDTRYLISIFAAITTILIITVIGMFDDLSVLFNQRARGTMKGYKRVGLKQWQKPLLTIPAAIPMMAIMAGNSSMVFPLIGPVNVGILYPFLFVPLAIVGASNAVNLLGGMNGLESGLGTIILASLGIFSYINGNLGVSFIAFSFAAALLAFLKFNWYPARIFPGDSLSYTIGAVIAVIAVLGNIEKFALYVFGIYFIEFLLKARSRLKAENFGEVMPDGTLKAPYEKSYSLTHVVMKFGRLKEWQVTLAIIGIELIFVAIAFSLSLEIWKYRPF